MTYTRSFIVKDRDGNFIRRSFSGVDRQDALAKTFAWERARLEIQNPEQKPGVEAPEDVEAASSGE